MKQHLVSTAGGDESIDPDQPALRVRGYIRYCAWLLIFPGFIATSTARAQAPDDEESRRPGLIARYYASAASAAQPIVVRLEPDLSHHWGGGRPDVRLPDGLFVARWSGWLLIQSPGKHQFAARTDGDVRVKVSDQLAVDGTGDQVKTTEIDLPPGFVKILFEYRHVRGDAYFALDWQGPGFGREPLPARLLYHDPPAPGPRGEADGLADRFETGRRLADRFGCANCHKILDLPRHTELGPPLADAAQDINPAWLRTWLANPISARPGTRMPAIGHGLPADEVSHIVAFLSKAAPKPRAPTNEVRMALNVADPAKGRLLFRSVGCLGCHTVGGSLAGSPDRAAPDLADLPSKRKAASVASQLEHPKGEKPSRHRPDLRLSADEAAHLAAYLVSPTVPIVAPAPAAPEKAGDPDKGRALIGAHRCAACHAIPGLAPPANDRVLEAGSSWMAGCLSDQPQPGVPHFDLSDRQRRGLRALVAGLPKQPSASAPETLAQDAIRRLNCMGCHTRDGEGGVWLGAQIAEALANDAELGGLKGTLTPPNLSAVGDKLRAEYLAESLRGRAPTARPWLSVRMPAFPFASGEAEAIVAYLRTHDRTDSVVESEPAAASTQPDARTIEQAVTLIGQRGFGCVSCHVLAGKIPPGGEPETLGPDLALAHRRMTDRYFHRWISNPQRIIAGTPMPQFVQPVAGAGGSLDDQLATLWQLLGSSKVAEVAAFGTRELLKPQGERALVVRDMVIAPDAPLSPYTPRGIAIGLKNGHSLLFDADRLAWVAWWRGGFLSRTKSGRLWEWHPEGDRLWTAPERGSPVVFLGPDGTVEPPGEERERFGSFASLKFGRDDVTLEYVLNGPKGSRVRVEDTVSPTADGWERTVRASGVPDLYRPALAERLPVSARPTEDERAFAWTAAGSQILLRPIEPSAFLKTTPDAARHAPQARLLPMTATPDGRFNARVRVQVR